MLGALGPGVVSVLGAVLAVFESVKVFDFGPKACFPVYATGFKVDSRTSIFQPRFP